MAFVRLLPTVGPPVVNEVGAVCEGFAALCALEGPFPGMGTLMILQLGASIESLGTFQALVGAFPGMSAQMLFQLCATREGLFTLLTFVLFHPTGGQAVLERAGFTRQIPVCRKRRSTMVYNHYWLLKSDCRYGSLQLSLPLFLLIKIAQQAPHQDLRKRLAARRSLRCLLRMVVWGDTCMGKKQKVVNIDQCRRCLIRAPLLQHYIKLRLKVPKLSRDVGREKREDFLQKSIKELSWKIYLQSARRPNGCRG